MLGEYSPGGKTFVVNAADENRVRNKIKGSTKEKDERINAGGTSNPDLFLNIRWR